MKFKSQVYTEASGSIGGITYSHNRGGMYTRARAIPVNPNSEYQQAVRNYVRILTARWSQNLTAANRAAWTTFADQVLIPDALGEPRKLPPLAHYVRANVPRLQLGGTVVDAGPTIYALPTMTAPVLTATAPSAGSLAFTNTDDWAGEIGGYMNLYISRGMGSTIGYFKGPYRYTDKVVGAVVPPSSPKVVTLPFVVVAGQKVCYKVAVMRADGRLSSSLFLSCTAA
jgi:hypothetical protein